MSNIAIEALERTLREMDEEYQRKRADIMSAIAELGKKDEPTKGVGAAVRPGQYVNMEPAIAMRLYLQERGGGPVPYQQMVRDLRAGGLKSTGKDKWSEDRYQRIPKIVANNGKNREIFHYNDDADTIELVRPQK